MTKFIFDTKAIMTSAWDMARKRQAWFAARGTASPVRKYFASALKDAWDSYRSDLIKAAEDEFEAARKSAAAAKSCKSAKSRYLELLSIAQRDNLNHGKSWYCGEREIETMGMNPMHEGELVCYVYAN